MDTNFLFQPKTMSKNEVSAVKIEIYKEKTDLRGIITVTYGNIWVD